MNDFVLNIDGYEGPMELLLDLAKKQEVDLKHISILELADQYSNYVKIKIKTTNLRILGPATRGQFASGSALPFSLSVGSLKNHLNSKSLKIESEHQRTFGKR